MGHARAHGGQALDDFQAGAETRLRPGVTPGRQGQLHAVQQVVGIVLVVGHAEVEAVGRALGARTADGFRSLQLEMAVQQALESGLGALHRLFRILLEAFPMGRPVVAAGDSFHGAFEGGAVMLEQFEGGGLGGGRHAEILL
ncbi:hypothetical protein D9M71_751210 [compost metagenome]